MALIADQDLHLSTERPMGQHQMQQTTASRYLFNDLPASQATIKVLVQAHEKGLCRMKLATVETR